MPTDGRGRGGNQHLPYCSVHRGDLPHCDCGVLPPVAGDPYCRGCHKIIEDCGCDGPQGAYFKPTPIADSGGTGGGGGGQAPCPAGHNSAYPYEAASSNGVQPGLWAVICGTCGWEGPMHETPALAVEAWNARPSAGWRPIASAPRDGTRILGHRARWTECKAVVFWSADWGDWYCVGGTPFLGATHWMPLPPGPEED